MSNKPSMMKVDDTYGNEEEAEEEKDMEEKSINNDSHNPRDWSKEKL
jgi:hypothetical protein